MKDAIKWVVILVVLYFVYEWLTATGVVGSSGGLFSGLFGSTASAVPGNDPGVQPLTYGGGQVGYYSPATNQQNLSVPSQLAGFTSITQTSVAAPTSSTPVPANPWASVFAPKSNLVRAIDPSTGQILGPVTVNVNNGGSLPIQPVGPAPAPGTGLISVFPPATGLPLRPAGFSN